MITITEQAIHKIQEHLQKRANGLGIRIGVKTTGCNGYSYILEFVDEPDHYDREFAYPGFSLFVDQKSLNFVNELEIDYVKQEINEGFEFKNPQERGRCGCGESFTI